ncbi:MAG: SCO1664 family protein [Chloroflexi bacterium]|nr:SCO1664 family protein [Chloroflexota bacterium]
MSPRRQRNRNEPADDDTDGIPVELSEEEACPLLQSGEIISGYRMPWGSNYTFMVRIDAGPGKHLRAIYKPRDGERPLYDFPAGTLYKRELATFVLSRDLGWPDVPLTLIREGPYGVGSIQHFIECDPQITYFDMIDEKAEELQKFAIFDLLVNNADRKAGHCLLDKDGRVWSIDHGLTFHPVFKLRTVMMEFWGQPIPDDLIADLEALRAKLESPNGLVGQLTGLLSQQEVSALQERLQAILQDCALPALDPYRNVPWPWV